MTYWTPYRMNIWWNLSPESRDYDRVMAGVYPPGQGRIETQEYRDYWAEKMEQAREERDENDHGCSCHINPPCGHCESCPVCNCERCDDWHDTAGGEVCPKLGEEATT